MKATVAAVALALAPIVLPQAPTDPNKSAGTRAVSVSMNRLLAESSEGKAANQRLQQLAQKMSADIATREKDARTTQEELQRARQQAQTDFANAQRQIQYELKLKMNPALTEVASQHGAELILNSDVAIVWAVGRLDVTTELLNKLNAKPKG